MCGPADDDITGVVTPSERDRELNRLYVETGQQRSGVGAALLSAALQLPPMAGAERVFLTVWDQNGPAVRLYERFGFRTVASIDYVIGSAAIQDAVMMRPRNA